MDRKYYRSLNFCNYQDSDAMTVIQKDSREQSSWSKELSIEVLVKEFKPELLEKYEFENQKL